MSTEYVLSAFDARLWNDEIDTLTDAFSLQWGKYEALHGEATLKSIADEIIALSQKITTLSNRHKESSALGTTDPERDEAVITLFDTVKAYTVLPGETRRAAAQVVLAVLDGLAEAIDALRGAEDAFKAANYELVHAQNARSAERSASIKKAGFPRFPCRGAGSAGSLPFLCLQKPCSHLIMEREDGSACPHDFFSEVSV